METEHKTEDLSQVTKITTIIHKFDGITHNGLENGEGSGPGPIIDHDNQDKKWKIASITTENRTEEEKGQTIINETVSVVESKIQSPVTDNLKWEIESIRTLADDEVDNDDMPTQVRAISDFYARSDDDLNMDRTYEIQSINVVDDSKPIVITDPIIRDIDIEFDKVSSNNGSLFMEESWTEFHTVPIHSSSVQLRTQKLPRPSPIYSITPVKNDQTGSRSAFVGHSKMKNPVQTSKCDITIGGLHDEKSEPVDHFSYQYEDSSKAHKLLQLTSSSCVQPHYTYASFNSPHALSPISNRNCMKQSINVDNEDEEILGVPLIVDENQTPIKNLKDSQSYNSTTENVSFQIHNLSAEMKIEICVEMFHNSDPRRELWKRKKVTVTRLVELDLSHVSDKPRLQTIIDSCNAYEGAPSRYNQDGIQHDRVRTLTGEEAYKVFYNLMLITHDEERQRMSEENLYVTRNPNGYLTRVICEPQFLLYRATEIEYSSLFY